MIHKNIPLLTEAQKAKASLEFLSQTVGKTDRDTTRIIDQNSKVNRLSRRELREPYNKPFALAEIQHVIHYIPKSAPRSDMTFHRTRTGLSEKQVCFFFFPGVIVLTRWS